MEDGRVESPSLRRRGVTPGRGALGTFVVVAALVLASCGGAVAETDVAGPAGPDPTTAAPASDAASTATEPDAAPPPGGRDTGGSSVEANARVVRVVDGDTIVADIDGTEERVRLIGIDTPESVKRGSPIECFGKEASAHAKELLPEGTAIRLVLDVEERDRYDRLLAYVYRAADGEFVNLALARDGFAGLMTYPPNVAHVDEFRAAVSEAREQQRGLWSACAGEPPVGAS